MTSRLPRVPWGLAAGTEGRGALPSAGPGPHLDPASRSSLRVTLGSSGGQGAGRDRPSATILGRLRQVLAVAARPGAKPISPLPPPHGPWWGLWRSQAMLGHLWDAGCDRRWEVMVEPPWRTGPGEARAVVGGAGVPQDPATPPHLPGHPGRDPLPRAHFIGGALRPGGRGAGDSQRRRLRAPEVVCWHSQPRPASASQPGG